MQMYKNIYVRTIGKVYVSVLKSYNNVQYTAGLTARQYKSTNKTSQRNSNSTAGTREQLCTFELYEPLPHA